MRISAVLCVVLLLAGLSPAAAQQRPHRAGLKRITVGSLAAQGFEIKAVVAGGALIVQKGKDVYHCTVRIADTSPLSYQSDCYAIH